MNFIAAVRVAVYGEATCEALCECVVAGNNKSEGDMTESTIRSLPRLALIAAVAVVPAQVFAETLHAHLEGHQEVPAISTTGDGRFKAHLDRNAQTIEYELRYEALEGSIQQSHIHFGQSGVNGGISVFLCSNLGNGPSGTQSCPPPPATITGTIRSADVIGPVGQGIEAGAFDELVAAILGGKAYVNVHSDKWPGGEIRSEIR